MDTFEQAKQFFLAGVRHFEAGRFDLAHAQFEASLALVPQRASTLMNLGATRIRLGRFADADTVLEEAARLDPADAQTWGHRATALAEMGRGEEALTCADEALRLDACQPQVWMVRGMLLREFGQGDEAIASFRSAIDHGGNARLNGYYIAALGGGDSPPASTPREYVESLFDSYAGEFESHLVDVLHYDAPAVLAKGLGDRHFARALDLGCGTGLMGAQLRARAAHLTGVDISSNMIERSRARGVYDDLVHAELGEFLVSQAQSHDLVAAADVFNYVGDLSPVFAAAKNAMLAGGVFMFTVESASGDEPFVLQPTLRFAHGVGYIQSLAQQNGFEISATAQLPIRDDQRTPIPGLFAWLVRS